MVLGELVPSCGGDGDWIFYWGQVVGGTSYVFKMPASGGAPVRVSDRIALSPGFVVSGRPPCGLSRSTEGRNSRNRACLRRQGYAGGRSAIANHVRRQCQRRMLDARQPLLGAGGSPHRLTELVDAAVFWRPANAGNAFLFWCNLGLRLLSRRKVDRTGPRYTSKRRSALHQQQVIVFLVDLPNISILVILRARVLLRGPKDLSLLEL